MYIGVSKLSRASLTIQDYAALAELRHQIHRFVRCSREVSRNTGLEPQQHQLMLTLRGLPEGTRPCVGEIAPRLQLKHRSHSNIWLNFACKPNKTRDREKVLNAW